MSDIQIPNISISNFKCFKEFSIDSFKRFNLIFGKNSVGKSNLLEALHLYSNIVSHMNPMWEIHHQI